ncbi:MAG: GTP-binding protein [Thermonemataceae bacterium]|nr:GTP-binding protein [Thermonemataceae bacterium]
MDILRFLTAGSVDDGKSTLIGRLLYDSNSLLDDQLEAITKASSLKSDKELDLALFTDGLKAEREQGITIDVAYKYFQTKQRKFIIADCPGHIQYTRNMVTGASNSDVALILLDARKGIVEQTKRHTAIAAFFGIKHFVVCINKMDLVAYQEDAFHKIKEEYLILAKSLGISSLFFIPMSATQGENVVNGNNQMSWYKGQTLLELLETLPIKNLHNYEQKRFQVQYVIRPQSEELHDYRGFAGQILSGVFKKGEKLKVFSSGQCTEIKEIELPLDKTSEAYPPMSVTMELKDAIDISRGDMLVGAEENIISSKIIRAFICWMDDKQRLSIKKRYVLQKYAQQSKCYIEHIENFFNIHKSTYEAPKEHLELNEMAEVLIRMSEATCWDTQEENPKNAHFILIDEQSKQTVAAGVFKSFLEC